MVGKDPSSSPGQPEVATDLPLIYYLIHTPLLRSAEECTTSCSKSVKEWQKSVKQCTLLKGSSKARTTQILCHGMSWFFVQGIGKNGTLNFEQSVHRTIKIITFCRGIFSGFSLSTTLNALGPLRKWNESVHSFYTSCRPGYVKLWAVNRLSIACWAAISPWADGQI